MTDLRKAAEMALAKLDHLWEIAVDERMGTDVLPEIKALRQALAQPEQESVICRNIYEVWAGSEGILRPLTSKEAYLLGLVEQMRDEAKKGLKPLYTAPPKREWVGLDEDRVDYLADKYAPPIDPAFQNDDDYWKFYQEIEAELKEKNT